MAPTEKDKTLNPEKGGKGTPTEIKTDLLANIIEKINIMYAGRFTEADRVIIETIFDKMMKASKGLRRQAKNNDAAMFEASIFPKEFEKVAQTCYMEQMDAFSKLFEDEQFYSRVMSEMAKAMYLSYRDERADAPKSRAQYAPISEENLGEYGSMAAEDLRKDDDRAEN